MALPLIPLVLAAGTAYHGIYKGIKAKQGLEEADNINSSAKDYAQEAEDFIIMAKEKTQQAILDLGKTKIEVLTSTIPGFLQNFREIEHMELDSDSFPKLKAAALAAEQAAEQIAEGDFNCQDVDYLLSFGSYSPGSPDFGSTFWSATAGSSLASLTGVAATNGTLLWLGGRALIGGGVGLAGSALVLGGLVVGPALAVGGAVYSGQAKAALKAAQDNYQRAQDFRVQAQSIGQALKEICQCAEQLNELLQGLNGHFGDVLDDLKAIINTTGNDWDKYSGSEKATLCQGVVLASAIEKILDIVLINEDGELNSAVEQVLDEGNSLLTMLNPKDIADETDTIDTEEQEND